MIISFIVLWLSVHWLPCIRHMSTKSSIDRAHAQSYLIYHCLNWPHSPPQTTSRLIHAMSHNYTKKSPLVTTGCHTFTPQNAPSSLTVSTRHPIHQYLNRPHSPPQMASRSNQLFFHNSLTRQTNRQTDGCTDRRGNKPVPTPGYALLLLLQPSYSPLDFVQDYPVEPVPER